MGIQQRKRSSVTSPWPIDSPGTTTGALMARTLSKIKEQIAKLQKEADLIQSSVIARIRKEIALHDLTVEHLFGSATAAGSEIAKQPRTAAPKAPATRKKAAGKPAKFADDQGNTWGGMGKRPQWIREALEAGRTLEDFLVSASKLAAQPKARATRQPKVAVAPTRKKVAASKQPAVTSAPAPKAKVPAKKTRKPAASMKKVSPQKRAAKRSRAAPAPASTSEPGGQTAG